MLFTRNRAVAALTLLAGLVVTTAAGAQESSPQTGSPDSQVQQFEDWAVECRDPGGVQAKDCVMFQRQTLKDGRTLLLMSVQRSAAGGEPFVVLQLPLGVLLGPGVTITVDDSEPRVMAYRLCNQNGCMVTFPLEGEAKSAFMKGETARVEMTTGDGKSLEVDVSLMGFSAALDSL